MQATFELVIEIADTLPLADLQKLSEWVQSRQRQQAQEEAKRAQVEEEIHTFQRAMQWIKEHRHEYLGQWVCLEGDELVSAGTDALQVHAEAKAKGIRTPFVEHIVEEPEAYLGGWEACQ